MADVTITAANVAKTTGTIQNGTAGATITAGQALYEDTADSNKLKLADADNTSTTATIKGVALNGAASGQPVSYLQAGATMDLGATLTVGTVYVLSGTAGGIAPYADLASNDYVTIVGYATAADSITLLCESTGVQVP